MEEFTPTQAEQITTIVRRELDAFEKRIEANRMKSSFTISETAKILKCSRYKLSDLIRDGHLEIVMIGKRKYVSKRSILKIQTPQ